MDRTTNVFVVDSGPARRVLARPNLGPRQQSGSPIGYFPRRTFPHHYPIAAGKPADGIIPPWRVPSMASRRIRTTVTVREDSPVPRKRRNNKSTTAVIAILLVLAGLFVVSRVNHQSGPAVHRATVGR